MVRWRSSRENGEMLEGTLQYLHGSTQRLNIIFCNINPGLYADHCSEASLQVTSLTRSQIAFDLTAHAADVGSVGAYWCKCRRRQRPAHRTVSIS